MALDSLAMREALAVAYAGQAKFMSLHTGDPAGTGALEVSGGSPAYSRQPITWNAGTTDGSVVSDVVTLILPAGTTVKYVGLWTAQTGGTYLDKVSWQETAVDQTTVKITMTYVQD